jgi:hypothetical protein
MTSSADGNNAEPTERAVEWDVDLKLTNPSLSFDEPDVGAAGVRPKV